MSQALYRDTAQVCAGEVATDHTAPVRDRPVLHEALGDRGGHHLVERHAAGVVDGEALDQVDGLDPSRWSAAMRLLAIALLQAAGRTWIRIEMSTAKASIIRRPALCVPC
jgi:hypothetical protein